MQVSIETTSGLERRVTVRLPAERFETEVQSRLRDAARRVRIPGFRPGRVPLREVRRRFGEGVRQEVAGELMQATVFEAIARESLRPAGQPRLEPLDLGAGGDFTYTATFEVFPEVELADFARVEVERPVAEVTETDVDTMIERLREQHRAFEPREDRAAEQGDEVTLDFTGYVDDEAFEGGQAEDARLVLGSGRMIPGFEEGVVGLKPGEEKQLEVTFPEDYGNEALKGKSARFEVRVKTVAEPVLPALDEDFFREFGVEEGGLQEFRAEVRGNMERELRNAVRTRLKNQVMDALAELHEVALPHAMVQEEIHRMQHEMVRQFGGQGMDPHSLPAELFRDNAERRVKLGLVLNRIVEAESLEAEPERVEQILDDVAAPYSEPEQVKTWYHANEEQMQQIRSAAIEEQVIDLVLERARVEDVERSYDEVLAAARGDAPAQGAAEPAADGEETA